MKRYFLIVFLIIPVHNLGRINEAKRDVDKAISLDPGNETYKNFKRDNLN